jgi:hypothetical protein
MMGKRHREDPGDPAAPSGYYVPWREDRVLRLGTDFSGLDVVVLVLRRLGVLFEHCFSSDSDPKVRALIQHQHKPNILFEDVTARVTALCPAVDLYVLGPPCQTFSSAGKQAGTSDPRGQLFLNGLDYVVLKRPRVVIFENVPRITQHKNAVEVMFAVLDKADYKVWWQILDSQDYGVPQQRKRFYLVAVLITGNLEPFSFPGRLTQLTMTRLDDMIPRRRGGSPDWRPIPPRPRAASLVTIEYEKLAAKRINPYRTPVCVDTGGTPAWVYTSVGRVMTLTKSHCEAFSYWSSSKGDFLDVDDYTRLQGLDVGDLDWQGAGVTRRQFAGMLGNAMAANVLEFVIPCALKSAGMISNRRYIEMSQNSFRRWGRLRTYTVSTAGSAATV